MIDPIAKDLSFLPLKFSWNKLSHTIEAAAPRTHQNGAAASYTWRVNDYASGNYKVSPKTPMFFASWVLERIAAITGVKITGSFFAHPLRSELILFNTSEAKTATFTGYFGEVDHLIPWQIDHLIVWRPVAEKSCRSSFKNS